jgi:hypothetical protein
LGLKDVRVLTCLDTGETPQVCLAVTVSGKQIVSMVDAVKPMSSGVPVHQWQPYPESVPVRQAISSSA